MGTEKVYYPSNTLHGGVVKAASRTCVDAVSRRRRAKFSHRISGRPSSHTNARIELAGNSFFLWATMYIEGRFAFNHDASFR
jgi:hypothetical protein